MVSVNPDVRLRNDTPQMTNRLMTPMTTLTCSTPGDRLHGISEIAATTNKIQHRVMDGSKPMIEYTSIRRAATCGPPITLVRAQPIPVSRKNSRLQSLQRTQNPRISP